MFGSDIYISSKFSHILGILVGQVPHCELQLLILTFIIRTTLIYS